MIVDGIVLKKGMKVVLKSRDECEESYCHWAGLMNEYAGKELTIAGFRGNDFVLEEATHGAINGDGYWTFGKGTIARVNLFSFDLEEAESEVE